MKNYDNYSDKHKRKGKNIHGHYRNKEKPKTKPREKDYKDKREYFYNDLEEMKKKYSSYYKENKED